MSEWTDDPFAEDSEPEHPSVPVSDTGVVAADGTGADQDGGPHTGSPAIPAFMVAAMKASGVDPDAVAAQLAQQEEIIPSDEQAAFLQSAARTGGLRCEGCKSKVRPDDPTMLVEVIGWSKHRAQGGQNHVIDRAETGRVMCGECGSRLIHLGSVGYAQETLQPF